MTPVDMSLRFLDGLVVFPEDCPKGWHARRHWRPGPNGRAICACTPEPVARDDWSFGYQAVGA